MIVLILTIFFAWLIVNAIWPNFFNPFQYWYLADNIVWAVIDIWPLYLHGIIVAVPVLRKEKNLGNLHILFYTDKQLLRRNIYFSVMAGLLEEIGFRCMFIFIAMIPIVITNVLSFGLVMLLLEKVLFPITNIVTFGFMHDTIYGFPAVYMAGALIANMVFGRVHKNKGDLAMITSWFKGMYLLHIMLHRGLVIAILSHILYGLIINVMLYIRISLLPPQTPSHPPKFFQANNSIISLKKLKNRQLGGFLILADNTCYMSFCFFCLSFLKNEDINISDQLSSSL